MYICAYMNQVKAKRRGLVRVADGPLLLRGHIGIKEIRSASMSSGRY